MAGAGYLVFGDRTDLAALMSADRGERVELTFLRLGDHIRFVNDGSRTDGNVSRCDAGIFC